MDSYILLKWVHVVSAAVLFGTGLGKQLLHGHTQRQSHHTANGFGLGGNERMGVEGGDHGGDDGSLGIDQRSVAVENSQSQGMGIGHEES